MKQEDREFEFLYHLSPKVRWLIIIGAMIVWMVCTLILSNGIKGNQTLEDATAGMAVSICIVGLMMGVDDSR